MSFVKSPTSGFILGFSSACVIISGVLYYNYYKNKNNTQETSNQPGGIRVGIEVVGTELKTESSKTTTPPSSPSTSSGCAADAARLTDTATA